MKKYYLLLLFSLFACSSESGQAVAQNPDDVVNQACSIGSVQEFLAQYQCLQKGAEAGNQIDQYNLSIYYLNYNPDKPKGMFWLTQSAEQGYATAQYNLAVELWKSQNLEQALYWAEKAKQNQFPMADDILGLIYIGKKEYGLAKTYFEQSAQLGNGNSMYNLGLLYQNGTGVKQDLETALAWYQKAADNGSIDAYVNLGVLYGTEGKFYSPEKSMKYLELAISNHHQLSGFALANLILRGKVAGDLAEVETLLSQSAHQNCYPAAKLLAHLYAQKISYPQFSFPINQEKSDYFSNLAQKIVDTTGDKRCNMNTEFISQLEH